MRRTLRHPRRGMAILLAVTMVGLAGVTMATLATVVAADARRTRSASTEAQLRQLLTAATVQIVQSPPAATELIDVPVPAELRNANYHLTARRIASPDDASIEIEITATSDRVTLSQTVVLSRSDGDARRLTRIR